MALALTVCGLLLAPAFATAAPLGQITEFSSGLNAQAKTEDIIAGPDGNLWFSVRWKPPAGPAAVGRITSSGAITEFPNTFDPEFLTIQEIISGPDGNLWYAGSTWSVGRITPSGTFTRFDIPNEAAGTLGIVGGPDGNLWAVGSGLQIGEGEELVSTNPGVERVTPSGTVTDFSSGLRFDAEPRKIVAGPDGNLWFTDESETNPFKLSEPPSHAEIGRVTPSGTITEFSADLGSEAPNADSLGSIVAGPDGNVWFTGEKVEETESNGFGTAIISRITPTGVVTGFPLPEGDHFSFRGYLFGGGFVAGPDGNLWFTGLSQTRSFIGRITPSGTITEFSSGLKPGAEPRAIIQGPEGNLWFTDEGEAPAIGRITPSGQINEFSAGLNAGSLPRDIVAGPDNNLWFTDEGAIPAIGRIGTEGELPSPGEEPPAGGGGGGSGGGPASAAPAAAAVSPAPAPAAPSARSKPKPLKCKKGFKKKKVHDKLKCVRAKSHKRG